MSATFNSCLQGWKQTQHFVKIPRRKTCNYSVKTRCRRAASIAWASGAHHVGSRTSAFIEQSRQKHSSAAQQVQSLKATEAIAQHASSIMVILSSDATVTQQSNLNVATCEQHLQGIHATTLRYLADACNLTHKRSFYSKSKRRS